MSNSKRVFLVDDSKIFRFTVTKMLSITGYDGELEEFEDGSDAYEFLKANLNNPEKLPDLILLDINMPVMGGWDFMEAFSKLDKPSKVIEIRILSSSIDPIDVKRADEFKNVVGYLTKPLNLPQIQKILLEKGLIDKAAVAA